MDYGNPSSSSHSAMTSKIKKNQCATFKIKIKNIFISLQEEDDELFKNW